MSKPKSFDSWPPEKQSEYTLRKRELIRLWKQANPDKVRENQTKWKRQNPDKVRYYRIKYEQANLDKIRTYKRQYQINSRRKNPQKFRERLKRSRKKNPELYRKFDRIKRENLEPSYIATLLKCSVVILKQNPDLLESHRTVIQLKRILSPSKTKKETP
jgi:hypothetical protein